MHYLHTLALLYKQLVLNKQKLYKDVAIAGEPNSAGFGSCVFPPKLKENTWWYIGRLCYSFFKTGAISFKKRQVRSQFQYFLSVLLPHFITWTSLMFVLLHFINKTGQKLITEQTWDSAIQQTSKSWLKIFLLIKSDPPMRIKEIGIWRRASSYNNYVYLS